MSGQLIAKFQQHWAGFKIPSDAPLLLALSGGADSTALFCLLRESGMPFSAAHVNYGLRGKESDKDEAFCKALCKAHSIPLYVYGAADEMKSSGASIQEKARTIRYRFFNELAADKGFNFILTAHHSDDSIETFFINLLRGSGVNGLAGIPEKNGNIIRPLLHFSKAELIAYLLQNGQDFCEDASNRKNDYLRNRIRHHLPPALEKIEPCAEKRILQSIENLSADSALLGYFIAREFPDSIDKTAIATCLKFPAELRAALLFQRFRSIGLQAAQALQLAAALEGIPGKQFYCGNHRILIDREYILAEEITPAEMPEILINETDLSIPGYTLQVMRPEEAKLHLGGTGFLLDMDSLQFPLCWRKILPGDSMIPLGMKGRKNISDILIDQKTDRFSKEKLHVLCSRDEIVWLESFRISDSSKITAHTSRVLHIFPENW